MEQIVSPYIGITGFMSSQEVNDILNNVNLNSTTIQLMVGVLASQKSMQGIANKWPNRYPAVNEIAKIFLRNKNCLNLIHYNTKEQDTLFQQLCDMTDIAGKNFNGFQLNIAWPSVEVLEDYKNLYPDNVIVLQIGSNAFEQVQNSPVMLADKVHSMYAHLIDYVLLDPSGGTGQPFDPNVALVYLRTLSVDECKFGLGVAGGLSSETMNLLTPISDEFPFISIDAEGKLRNEDDHLDIKKASLYFQSALGLLNGPVV